MNWKQIVRNYFTFNRRERRGLVLLSSVLLLLISVHLFLRLQEDPPLEYTITELPTAEPAPSNPMTANAEMFSNGEKEEHLQKDYDLIDWQSFNPNEVSAAQLQELGLDEKISERLIKYRSKGGLFTQPDDLYRIYGIDSSWVESALPYAKVERSDENGPNGDRQLKETSSKLDRNLQKRNKAALLSVNLNTADTNELKAIPGIGSYYANAIVRYRERLGGYISFEQLLDVYHMRDEVMDALATHTKLQLETVHRININSCRLEDLGKHPYLTWKEAKAVVNYRKHHGNYQNTKEILETDMIADSVYLKIAPYLTVQ